MNKILISQCIAVLLLITTIASAQKQSKQSIDSLTAYREFISLGKWYLNTPLNIKVHYINKTTPFVRETDNMENDILLYYGKDAFYMNTGGMEQIVNDSLTVLVNNEAKMIKLFSNPNALKNSMERIIPTFVPDSSLQKLASQYSIIIHEEGKDIKKMTLESRSIVSGTSLNKESISIVYNASSYQPVNYTRATRNLIPVDSAVFVQMEADPDYSGRTVRSKTSRGVDLFFVLKEKTTECRFLQVSYQVKLAPVLPQDRVVKGLDGEYSPAKGFEEYLVSKEF